MPEELRQSADCVDRIAKFSGTSLASKIAELEFNFVELDRSGIAERLRATGITGELLEATRIVKRAAAQIDVVLHALGILICLPSILEDGEVVRSLSLGAGSSETKRFDLETDRRVASSRSSIGVEMTIHGCKKSSRISIAWLNSKLPRRKNSGLPMTSTS